MKCKVAGIFAVFLVLIFITGCAPKKVKTYEHISDIRSEVVQSAVNMLGKPYKNGAKGPDSFDCSGLAYYVYKKSGVSLPVSTDKLIRIGYEIQRSEVLPGDLVFFKIKKDLHAGIMLNSREFIHASKSRGVAVDDVDTNYWKKSLIGYRSILY
ncbi:MAG: C40 family peptidase [Proteobacteria bacterium]|nr:C40 family peptidase [Pseudomonadota bacterium]